MWLAVLLLGSPAIVPAETARDELRRILVKLESPDLSEQVAERYGTLLISALHASTTPSFAFEVVEKFMEQTPAADRAGVYRAAAELAELTGDYERAARYFAATFEHSETRDPADALAAARAQIDLGDLERAENHVRAALAQAPTGHGMVQSMSLLARILTETGRDVEASAVLHSLVPVLAESNIGDAYSVFGAAAMIGLDDVKAAARERVEAFPDSVEAALVRRSATDSRVDPFPSPSRVMNPERVFERTVAPTSEPLDERPILRGIQTGSFRDEENARYMARDLRELGFSADVRSRVVAETTFHQVVIAVDGDPDRANTTIMRLKERGIEGFLVFD